MGQTAFLGKSLSMVSYLNLYLSSLSSHFIAINEIFCNVLFPLKKFCVVVSILWEKIMMIAVMTKHCHIPLEGLHISTTTAACFKKAKKKYLKE